MNHTERGLIALMIGLIIFVVFLATPPGRLLQDMVAMVPGAVWGWLLGIAAFIALVLVYYWGKA